MFARRAGRLLGSVVVALALAPLLLLAHAARRPRLADSLQVALCRVLLAGLRVRVVGTLAPARATLVVSNHVSWLDVLVIGSRLPACFLAKREVAAWPLVGPLARLRRTVFVDRARRRSILPANRAIAALLAGGQHVVLFAEGTTSADTVLPFRTAHLASLAPATGRRDQPIAGAMPVAIAYSDPVAAWVGDESLLPHLARLLAAPPLRCAVRAGPTRSLRPGFDRKALGRELRDDVVEGLARLCMRATSPRLDGAASRADPGGMPTPP